MTAQAQAARRDGLHEAEFRAFGGPDRVAPGQHRRILAGGPALVELQQNVALPVARRVVRVAVLQADTADLDALFERDGLGDRRRTGITDFDRSDRSAGLQGGREA